jgi:hypothetical protein
MNLSKLKFNLENKIMKTNDKSQKVRSNSKNNQRDEVKFDRDVLNRATNGSSTSIESMFKKFIPDDERIICVGYLGIQGLWFIGIHSFICLTERRVADITIGNFGEVTYQDGYLEDINSSFIYQPSKPVLWASITSFYLSNGWLAYWAVGGWVTIIFIILAILLLPFLVRIYYRFVKCGIVFAVREGISIYVFCDRKYLKRVIDLAREVTLQREIRIKLIKKIHT